MLFKIVLNSKHCNLWQAYFPGSDKTNNLKLPALLQPLGLKYYYATLARKIRTS